VKSNGRDLLIPDDVAVGLAHHRRRQDPCRHNLFDAILVDAELVRLPAICRHDAAAQMHEGLRLAHYRLEDEVERFNRELAAASPTTTGSRRQVRVNPLFAEARAHRLALARLYQQLGLKEATAGASDPGFGTERSDAGRKLAYLRHRRGRA
jgi:hypothetical protein